MGQTGICQYTVAITNSILSDSGKGSFNTLKKLTKTFTLQQTVLSGTVDEKVLTEGEDIKQPWREYGLSEALVDGPDVSDQCPCIIQTTRSQFIFPLAVPQFPPMSVLSI